jgi:DNA-binding MarR family transcriptional regulator
MGRERFDEIYKQMYGLDCFGCVVHRIDRLIISRLNEKLRSTGSKITHKQFQILLCLWENDGLLQAELARMAEKDKASLARMLDIMENKENLVVRATSGSDHRQKRVFLTNKGKELQDILTPAAIELNLEIASMFDAQKMNAIRNELKQLIDILLKDPNSNAGD